MLVPLANTLNALRAHMAVGVLAEHGIEAWVWGDLSSSGYGMLVNAGCQLVVNEEDVAEAATVLNELPPPAVEPEGEAPSARPPATVEKAIGTGLVAGALNLPVLMVLWFLLQIALIALRRMVDPHAFIPEVVVPASLLAVIILTVGCVIYGAMLGALGGWFAWLLGDFRRGGGWGRGFVWIITVILVLPEFVVLLAALILWLMRGAPLRDGPFSLSD